METVEKILTLNNHKLHLRSDQKLRAAAVFEENDVFSRRFSFKGKMPDYSSDCFFSSDYNPHTDRSTS